MVSSLYGRFCLSARKPMIIRSGKGNFESEQLGGLIPSSSCTSSDHIQDTQKPDKVALVRKELP